MTRASKTKQEALARLRGVEPKTSEPGENHSFDPERTIAFAECVEWLEQRRRQVGLTPDSEEFQEVLAVAQEHRDYLNHEWADGSLEGFKESLRRYARALADEMLRTYRAKHVRQDVQQSAQETLESFGEGAA